MKFFNLIYLFVIIAVFVLIGSFAYANDIEKKFINAGLVDVNRIDNSIKVDLVNSDPQKNYFRENYYNGLSKAYLRKEIAIKLSKAQKILKTKQSNYSLLILDAARPRSVSMLMYEKMKETKFEKYVANPSKGSMHNYGVAVDITIIDENGDELYMGFSPFRKSTFEIYWQFAKMKLGFDFNDKQIGNRRLLSETMISAGFLPLSHEWWHYNGLPKDLVRKKYQIIE
jgi:D-alanyl-D-alanine dipeptidase